MVRQNHSDDAGTIYCPNCERDVEYETTSNPNPSNPRVALVQDYCPDCEGVL